MHVRIILIDYNRTTLDSNTKWRMKLSYKTYLNAHAMSMHITFSHKKAAKKVNWIVKAARRTKHIQSYTSVRFTKAESLGFRILSIVRYSKSQRTQRFGNWVSFRTQLKGETPTLLGRLIRANLNHWTTQVKVTLRLAVYLQSVFRGFLQSFRQMMG
jgi:hypothetical protein